MFDVHEASVVLSPTTAISVGSVKITVAVAVHELTSVMVTVAVPEPSVVAVAPVSPFDQMYVNGYVPPDGVAVADPSFAPKQLISAPL